MAKMMLKRECLNISALRGLAAKRVKTIHALVVRLYLAEERLSLLGKVETPRLAERLMRGRVCCDVFLMVSR